MGSSYNAGEALAVTSSAAVGFTSATYGNNRNAFVQVQKNPIRYRIDATAPTALIGVEAAVGSVIQLSAKDQLVKFRAIAVGADAVLFAEFGY